MTDPTDPPRPSLRKSVRDYLAACVWNQSQTRVETSTGEPVFGWLNQKDAPTITAVVQWEAGNANELGIAVAASVPYETWDIIKNGSYDSQTGLVTHDKKSYRFRFEVVSGVATMQPYT